MTTLQNIKQEMGKAWSSLSHDWSQFMGKASDALTKFTPMKKEESETESLELARYAPRLGFMAAELMENDNDIVARIEAPGMEAGDFDVEITNGRLTVRGEKSTKREEKRGHYHMMECAYGSFQRSLPLPTEVEIDKAKAKYRNGVLKITLPKTPAAKRKRIEVEVR